uniref:Solute carrier family 29 (Nucleoside transporters), member 2 n=2 Tax=Iconisemion striatum TaxID=60296 RepID=A0A1A7YPW2_9TELE
MGRTDTPQDRGYLVGIIFFILGLGTLLPWNFFMTASLYFQDRLNNTEFINGTAVHKEYYFNNWMNLLSQLPLLLFTLLNSFLYQRISEAVRITGSLVAILLFFILTAVLVKVDMKDTDLFFSVTMATIWFINSFVAVLQGSLFGLVGLLPQRYSSIFMSGQGLAGTFAAIAILLSIASDVDPESAALGYFITPCVGTLITLFSYLLLPHLEFAQHYLNRRSIYEEGTTDKLLNGGVVENGKLNGHANGTVIKAVARGSSEVEEQMELSPEETKQVEKGQAKASVLEVLKKVNLGKRYASECFKPLFCLMVKYHEEYFICQQDEVLHTHTHTGVGSRAIIS